MQASPIASPMPPSGTIPLMSATTYSAMPPSAPMPSTCRTEVGQRL